MTSRYNTQWPKSNPKSPITTNGEQIIAIFDSSTDSDNKKMGICTRPRTKTKKIIISKCALCPILSSKYAAICNNTSTLHNRYTLGHWLEFSEGIRILKMRKKSTYQLIQHVNLNVMLEPDDIHPTNHSNVDHEDGCPK